MLHTNKDRCEANLGLQGRVSRTLLAYASVSLFNSLLSVHKCALTLDAWCPAGQVGVLVSDTAKSNVYKRMATDGMHKLQHP